MKILDIFKSKKGRTNKVRGVEKLDQIEKETGLCFPTIYKHFYKLCDRTIPHELVGTDLYNRNNELKKGAIELLEEDDSKFVFDKNDFVFMMHQGYMFWYFRADGDENPDVYYYHEGDLIPNKKEKLRDFLKEYVQK